MKIKPECFNQKEHVSECDDCIWYNSCEFDQLKEQDRRERGEAFKRDMDDPARYSKYD